MNKMKLLRILTVILVIAMILSFASISFAAPNKLASYKGQCINYFDCVNSVQKDDQLYIGVLSTNCTLDVYDGAHKIDYGYRLSLNGEKQSENSKYGKSDHCSYIGRNASGRVTLRISSPAGYRIAAYGNIYTGDNDYTSYIY